MSKLLVMPNAPVCKVVIVVTITVTNLKFVTVISLCGLVVRVSGYRYRGLGVRFPALPDFLSSSGSGTGSTQPREVN